MKAQISKKNYMHQIIKEDLINYGIKFETFKMTSGSFRPQD